MTPETCEKLAALFSCISEGVKPTPFYAHKRTFHCP